MKFSRPDADVYVPDGVAPEAALARVTHLCLVAHQDDIEIMAQAGITECHRRPEPGFGGVVLTDGAGAPRVGRFHDRTDAEMREIRRGEQREAARLGGYSIQIQLAHPSAALKGDGTSGVLRDLGTLLAATRPEVVYLHNPADKHDTHVAAFACCLAALRGLPRASRPGRVLGCEVWRDLDWLPDESKVGLDAGGDPKLAAALLQVFASQVEGGKRYDLATLGRRAANATFHQSSVPDEATAVTWAIDLTPLVLDASLDPAGFVLDRIDAFRSDVADRLRRYLRQPSEESET